MGLLHATLPSMKQGIHPKWYPNAKVTCSCGHTFETGSTQPEIRVEICSQCHPFYTGKKKLVDTEGRVDKFERRKVTSKKAAEIKATKEAKKKAATDREKAKPKTFKEMLELARKEVEKESSSPSS